MEKCIGQIESKNCIGYRFFRQSDKITTKTLQNTNTIGGVNLNEIAFSVIHTLTELARKSKISSINCSTINYFNCDMLALRWMFLWIFSIFSISVYFSIFCMSWASIVWLFVWGVIWCTRTTKCYDKCVWKWYWFKCHGALHSLAYTTRWYNDEGRT